jgi:2-polyprenyl-3-methyl-5-hydroxy-6-metoxy-1,4-benzoquinol methylase
VAPGFPDVETSSADYARRFAGAVGGWFLEVQSQLTLGLLAAYPGAKVLDVGGGHGQLTAPLVEAGYDVTVLGSDEVCVERVRALVDAGRAQFRAGDLLHAPFEDASFDVVLAFRLLPHVACWRALLAELSRLARRAVIVDYPTQRSANAFASALFGVKRGVEGNTRPFLVFRDALIEAAFRDAGLRVARRRPEFFFPMALHRALSLLPLSRGLEAAAGAVGLRAALGSPVVVEAVPRG